MSFPSLKRNPARAGHTPAGAGQPEAWFQLGTDGSVAKLKVGETLQVGQFTGIVARYQQP